MFSNDRFALSMSSCFWKVAVPDMSLVDIPKPQGWVVYPRPPSNTNHALSLDVHLLPVLDHHIPVHLLAFFSCSQSQGHIRNLNILLGGILRRHLIDDVLLVFGNGLATDRLKQFAHLQRHSVFELAWRVEARIQ